MRNLFEENPKLAIGVLAIAIVVPIGLSELNDRRRSDSAEEWLDSGLPGEGRAGTSASQLASERLRAVLKDQYRDPLGALHRLREIQASPKDAVEKSAAEANLPGLLGAAVSEYLKRGELDKAQDLLEELQTDYPESQALRSARSSWYRKREKQVSALVEAGEWDQAFHVLEEMNEAGVLSNGRLLKRFQEQAIAAWAATRNEGWGNEELLSMAARVLPTSGPGMPIARGLERSGLAGEKVLERANELYGSENKFRAVPYYMGALFCMNSHTPWFDSGEKLKHEQKEGLRKQLDHTLSSLYLALAEARLQDRRPLIMTLSAEDILKEGVNAIQTDIARRAPLIERLISLKLAELEAIAEPALRYSLLHLADPDKLSRDQRAALNSVLYDASALSTEIVERLGNQLWAYRVKDPAFDPWPLLPENVIKEMEALKAKGRSASSLQQTLASRVAKPDFKNPLPLLQSAWKLRAEIQARRGFYDAKVQPGQAVAWFRKARYAHPNPGFGAQLIDAEMRLLLNSQDPGDFDLFYELTSHLVGDYGLPALPKQHRQAFESALTKVAQATLGQDRKKAIFLWAVQADAFPDTPAGKAAAEKSLNAAFEEVSGLAPKRVEAARLKASVLPGFSQISINNSTDYHLLAFYRGAESFHLAVRPRQKISAVVLNGDYEIVTLAPDGGIQPFKGQANLDQKRQVSNYVIEESNSWEQQPWMRSGVAAYGDFTLTRKPPGVPEVKVDSKTGEVRPAS